MTCCDKRVQEMDQAAKKPDIVGRLTFANGDMLEFADPGEYIKRLGEEIDFINTTGMAYETLTDDPQTRKAVDDILYGHFGEENPYSLENYKPQSTTMQLGGM